MRKWLTGVAVFAIILMQVQGVFGLLQPQTAVAQEEQVILDNDAARVSVTSEVVSDTIEWTLQYAKHAPDDVQMRSIRIKLAEAEDGTGTVQRKEGDLNQADGDDWYREAEFTNSSEGKLIVTTPTTAKQLVVWLQIDSQTMGKTTADVLTGTDAEAKVVPAPEIPVVEEESKEESADVDAEEEEAIVVDQTPVDVGKPELTEVPEVKDEAEQKAAEEKRQAAEAHLAYAAPILLERVGSGSDQDQFTYVSEDDGTYPQDATDKHLPDGQNDNVRNYDYSNDKLETTNTKVNSILNTESDFANGYTTYSGGESADAYNVYTKKSVRPTSNENEYEIQLDVIGDAIESLPALDVVLVLDKSGSMHDDKATETRWEKLQQAVTSFSTELLDRGNDVQIGMTVFGGTTGDVSTGVPYAEIAAFSNLDDDDKDDAEFMGFTRNASDLTDHTAFSKNTPIGGTPTFLGLDAGLNLLWNTKLGARNDVAKVIITITDGEPTFSPQDTDNDGYSKDEDGELRTVQGSLNQSDHEINGDSLRYVLKNETGKSNNYTGNGTNNTHSASKTIAHVESRYGLTEYAKMHKYAIGFYTGDTANDVLNALGVEGTYKADDTQALQNALDEIMQIYTSQIVNGIITDPMSVAVAKKGSFTQSALLLKSGNLTVLQAGDQNYPQYAKDVKVEEDGERIVLSNVTLGRTDAGQEGLRITYLVELKNDYRNGDFYQTNDTTMLENFDGNYLHFAIPSVRDVPKKTSLTVKKQWVDENNKFDTQQELVMELYSRKNGSDDEWKLVNKETFAKGVTSHEFTDLIVAIGTTKMEYKVVEKIGNEVTNVYGYAMPTYGMQPITLSLTQPNQLTVKNELRYAQYEFTKVAGDGKTPLKDFSFTITRKGSNEAMNTVVSDQNGKVAFSSLPVGDYTVKEVVAPDGHQIADEFTIAVQDVGADKDLLVESTLKGHTLVNSLKPTELTVTKVDSITGNPLEGATFDLYQVAEEKNELIGTATSTEEGIVKFTKGLTPGDYKLVETGAPTGYMLMQGDFTFTITQLGKVMNFEYTGSDMDNAQTPTLHLTSGEALNQLSITAKNQAAPVVPLPLTGGTGLQIILIIGGLLIGIAGWLKLNDWRKHRGGDGDA